MCYKAELLLATSGQTGQGYNIKVLILLPGIVHCSLQLPRKSRKALLVLRYLIPCLPPSPSHFSNFKFMKSLLNMSKWYYPSPLPPPPPTLNEALFKHSHCLASILMSFFIAPNFCFPFSLYYKIPPSYLKVNIWGQIA